jgi:ATP-dependent protease ClpP protease subunit
MCFIALKLFLGYLLICIVCYTIDFFTENHIYLNKKVNLIRLEGNITETLIKRSIHNLNRYIHKKYKTVYVYINSDGGNFIDAYYFIMEMQNKKNIRFICIAKKASSSAFHIFQYCDKRYILKNSILLQHSIKIKIEGSIEILEDWYLHRFNDIKKKYTIVNKYVSNKINLDYYYYLEKIKNEWLIVGEDNILKNNLADKVVILK